MSTTSFLLTTHPSYTKSYFLYSFQLLRPPKTMNLKHSVYPLTIQPTRRYLQMKASQNQGMQFCINFLYPKGKEDTG